MANVKFILEADEAKAVRGFLKIRDAAKKAGKEVKVTTKNIGAMERAGKRAGRGTRRRGGFGQAFATGLGVGTGAGAVRLGVNMLQAMSKSSREITQEIGRQSAAFDRIVRPVAALGDSAKDIAKIRQEIISTSVGFGIEAQNVASGLFMLDSALGEYDESVKEAVKKQALLTAALGGDFNVSITAGASLWLIYGKRLEAAGISADDMMGKLSRIADLAKATPEEIGRFGLRTFASGAARGFSFQEVGAAIPFATGISGSTRKATTALANLIDRLGLAEQELGITLEGGLLDQLEQVRDAVAGDIKLTERIWGQALAGFANSLLENTEKFRSAQRAIDKADRTEQSRKLSTIRADRVSRVGEIFRAGATALENIGAIRGLRDPQLLSQALTFQALRLGTRLETSPFLQLPTEKLQELQALALGGKPPKVGAVQTGFDFLEQQARQAGDQELADLIATRPGRPSGLIRMRRPRGITGFFAGAGGQVQEEVPLTPRASQFFARRRAEDPTFTFEQFQELLQTNEILRQGLMGSNTGFPADVLPTSPLVMTPNAPAADEGNAKQIGKTIGQNINKANPNVGVEP